MSNPFQSLINWFRLEAQLVAVERKEWYAYLYKG